MMGKVTDSQPEVVEIDERIARTREQELLVADRAAKAGAKYRALVEKWQTEADEAVRAGIEPKRRPEPPDESPRNSVLATFRAEIERDLKERQRAIMRASKTIQSEVQREIESLLSAAIAPLDELQRIVFALRASLAALDDVAGARHALDPSRTTRHRRPPVIDLAALVSAVKHGPDALLGGRDAPRPLGLQPGSTLGMTPVEISEPTPPPADPITQVRQVRTSTGAEH